MPRTQLSARGRDNCAGLHVLTSQTDVLPRPRAVEHQHRVALHPRVFLHYHGVCASGQRRPGEEPHTGLHADAALEDLPCAHLPDEPQRDRFVRARRGDVRRAHGVTVHRGVVERREIE